MLGAVLIKSKHNICTITCEAAGEKPATYGCVNTAQSVNAI